MTSDYFINENKRRTKTFYNDEKRQDLMKKMNLALSEVHLDQSANPILPTIFIFGLPRSGTTLLYQLLSQTLEIGYVNNLIARFWLAPIFGIELSKSLLKGQVANSFVSKLGQTDGPDGPHEFSYFWQKWLKMNEIEDMKSFSDDNKEIDWAGLKDQVVKMQACFGNGILFKTMYAANHLKSFSKVFNQPLFIYIERDSFDVALSILSARKSYYGDRETWWATYPENYEELKILPFAEQIAGQVHSLKKTYARKLDEINEKLVVRIKYEDLCTDPLSIIERVNEQMYTAHKYRFSMIASSPKSFKQSVNKVIDADGQKVIDALNKLREPF